MNVFLYAMRYGTTREKIMTALPLTMNRKNIVKVRARGKTLTECLSALTECSEKSIRDTLGDLDATGWGTWDRCKGTFKVNKDVATCDTKAPDYEGQPLAISEMDRIRLASRISGLFQIETRTRNRDKDEEKEMTRAMMKKIDDLSEENKEMKLTLQEMLELMRKLVAGDEDAKKTAERHLRRVK
jgi:hypothetical protein